MYQLARFLGDHLRVVQLVRSARNALEARRSMGGIEVNQAGNDPSVLAPPRDRMWEEAWNVTELILAKVKEFAALNKVQHLFCWSLGSQASKLTPIAAFEELLKEAWE